MSPAHDLPCGADRRHQEPIDPQSVVTAVQVVSAWLLAFTCVALIALFS